MIRFQRDDSMSERYIYLFFVLTALSLSCGTASDSQTAEYGESETTLDTENMGASGTSGADNEIIKTSNEITGSNCPLSNFTRPCFCLKDQIRISGRQFCDLTLGWSDCECTTVLLESSSYDGGGVGVDPPTNKREASFKWKETVPSAGTCKAGHYSGVFSGLYNSPRMGNEDISYSPVGIPVLGTVEFDLREVGNGEYFEIENGAMEGFALVVFPFKGDLKGTFKCEGDQPQMDIGLKNGIYNAIGTNYYFDGRAVGLYDKLNSAFIKGEWAVTEPEDYTVVVRNEDGTADLSKAVYAPLPDLVPGTIPLLLPFVEGGTGEWNAFWVGPATGVGTTTQPSVDAGGP